MMITFSRRRLLGAMLVTGMATGACQSTPDQPAAKQEAPAGFTNPVVDRNVPDPMIIADDDGTWWAFATNGNGANIQTMRSRPD